MRSEGGEAGERRPRLRFPEFENSKGWTKYDLNQVLLEIANGLSLEQTLDSSGFRVTRIETISNNSIDEDKVGFVTTGADISPYRLNIGDILFSNINSIAHIGRAVIVDRDYNLYHGMNLLRLIVDTESNDSTFIFYLLNTDYIRSWIKSRANKAVNQASINQTELGRTPISVPLRKEQQKIADCLSSLDSLIAAQTQKLDALRSHKRGLMQQLFPAEGESTPRLRFPEFEDAGEWEERKLGALADFASGGTPSKDVPKYWGGHIPWISASSMYETKINKSELNVTELAIKNGTRIAKKGSLLILVRGSMLFNRIPMGIADIDVAFNQDVKALSIRGGVAVDFLLYELLSYESRISILSTGIGAGKIDTEELKELAILIPASAEQTRIADCLSSLDSLIAAQSDKIAELKTFKRGLMQQLFPAPDEVME